MAGLRNISVVPQAPMLEHAANQSLSNEDANRAGAGSFRRGLRSSGYADEAGARMQGALEAAAAGDVKTARGLRQQAEELAASAAEWSPRVSTYKDVNSVDTAMDYAAGAAGQAVRSTIPSLIAGTAAVVGARGAGLRRMGQALSGAAGAAVPAYQMEKHEGVLEASADPAVMARHTPQEILNVATGKGAINAGLESIFPATAAMRMAGSVAKNAARPSLRRVGAAVAGDVAVESGTEVTQGLVGQGAHTLLNPARDKSGDAEALINAGLQGAIGGGVLGAPSHALQAARVIAQDVASRTKPTAVPPAESMDVDGQQSRGPLDFLRDTKDSVMEHLRNAPPPMEVVNKGIDAVIEWQRDMQTKADIAVSDALKNDPDAAELSGRFEEDPKAHFAEAAGYLTSKHGVERVKNGVADMVRMAEDFHAGVTGREGGAEVEGEVTGKSVTDVPGQLPNKTDISGDNAQDNRHSGPKKNEQYTATDRAVASVFSEALPKDVDQRDALLTADMFRRFARGQLEGKQATYAARRMIEVYGDEAVNVAAKAAEAQLRDGVDMKAASQLPRLVQSMLQDETSQRKLLTKTVGSMVDNSAREHFQQQMKRPFGDGDVNRIARELDKLARGEEANVEGLHAVLGERLGEAVNIASAVHGARSRDISTMNKALNGNAIEDAPIDDETGEEIYAEGNDQERPQSQFDKEMGLKGIEKSAPAEYSFKKGAPNKQGVGAAFDESADAEDIKKRIETLKQKYPGANVTAISAEEYVRESGVQPDALRAALGAPGSLTGGLAGRVVLRIEKPTNTERAAFDQDTVSRLMQPVTLEREVRAGDNERGDRYQNQANTKTGGSFTRILTPGMDEGQFFVGRNNPDGTPQMKRDPETGLPSKKRVYSRVDVATLMKEVRKRDPSGQEGVDSKDPLDRLSSGIAALATSGDPTVDIEGGLIFLDRDGKRHTVAFKDAKDLPEGLTIYGKTVKELRAARSRKHDDKYMAELKEKALERVSTATKDELDLVMARARQAALETDELHVGTELMQVIDDLVQKRGFPPNLREGMTIEQKRALGEGKLWGKYVDDAVGKTPSSGGSATRGASITDFHAPGNEFLSNFYPAPVALDGVTYPSVEHAYQAAKTTDAKQREPFSRKLVTPGQAKRMGKAVTMRADWNAVKLDVMRDLVKQKFANDALRAKLDDTAGRRLVEGNKWGDTYWGMVMRDGKLVGENHLGKILMEVRDQFSAKPGVGTEARRLYDMFYTEAGYTRLTPKARAMRDVLPQLERRAEMVRRGETIDLETGLPEQNDTDVSMKEQDSSLAPDEELGYRTRTQAKPGKPQAPLSVPMNYRAPIAAALRGELRDKYPGGASMLKLIKDGVRTATTRAPFAKVGDVIEFYGNNMRANIGTYRVTSVKPVDLHTAEGREAWSKKEGWDAGYAMKAFPKQVYHGAMQTTFERVTAPVDLNKKVEVPKQVDTGSAEKNLNQLPTKPNKPVTDERAVHAKQQAEIEAIKREQSFAMRDPVPRVAMLKAKRSSRKTYVKHTDSAGQVLAKRGGIRASALTTDGVDPADLRQWNREHGNRAVRSTGVSLDGAAEILAEYGFDVHDEQGLIDATKARDIIDTELSGERVYSFEGLERLLSQGKMKSAQFAQDRPLTDAEKADIEAYVTKVLGPQIHTHFAEKLGHSGEWNQEHNTIVIAMMTGVNGMNVAYHEAMHGFVSFLMRNGHGNTVDVLKAAAGAPGVRKQLEKLLANEPAALRQLNDIEERVAYMYQFWAAGRLTIGPKTEGVFGKIKEFIKGVLGIVTNDEKALAIMQAFHDGKMTEPSAVARVLQNLYSSEKVPSLRHMIGRSLAKVGTLVVPSYDALKNSGNGEAVKIAELFWTDPTSTGKKQGYLNARAQQNAVWLNKFSQVVDNISPEDLAIAREVLQDVRVKVPNAQVAKVVNGTRKLLTDMYTYMHDSDVPVRFRKQYFPQVWDTEKLVAGAAAFKEKLLKFHRAELEAVGGFAYKAALKQWEHDRVLKPDAPQPKEAAFTPEVTADHIVATLTSQNGYVPDDSEVGKKALAESALRPGFTPFMSAVNTRTLDFLDMREFKDYLRTDLINIMSTYISQGVRRAEYAVRFGNEGHKLAAMHQRVVEQETATVRAEMKGAKNEDILREVEARSGRYARAIQAMEGTLGYDISPTLRRINSGMMVYQNIRILPLALFSSLIDPMGVMVRGGTMKDAFEAFKRGMLEISKGAYSDPSAARDEDPATKMAELLGTVDNKLMLDALGETYNSVYLYGWAKKLNEKLFQFNGMEGWNRAMRVSATQAAIGFIGRHAKGADAAHSARWLSELGLEAGDVKFNDDGSVKMLTKEGISGVEADKMRMAVQRWVDSAILRPNAAQRPSWASDPHFALIFHLKQFTYSFHQVILKRTAHEWVNGNLTPAMVLASYVPFMLAADIAKGLLQGGGDEPRWKEGWTLGDYTSNAVQRAGLLGIGQFALDAKHMGVSTLGGPTFEQGARAVSDPVWETAVRGMPGNPVYKDMLL